MQLVWLEEQQPSKYYNLFVLNNARLNVRGFSRQPAEMLSIACHDAQAAN